MEQSQPLTNSFSRPAVRVFILLALLGAASAVNLDWFRGWSSGKAAVRQKLNPFPSDFPLFFRDVHARTSQGEVVLVALNADLTHHAYLAEYELPNRRVFIGNWNSGAGMERAWEVDVIAAWPDSFVVPAGFREVFRGHHGVLARRVP